MEYNRFVFVMRNDDNYLSFIGKIVEYGDCWECWICVVEEKTFEWLVMQKIFWDDSGQAFFLTWYKAFQIFGHAGIDKQGMQG